MLIRNPPVELAEGLWMLGTNEYPLFLVKGAGEAAIFEGGTGAMGQLVLEQMEQLGMAKALVKQLVVTHAHPDHVMAVPLFRQAFPGIAVLASDVAAKTLAAEKALAFFTKIDRALTDALLKAGRIADEHRPKPLAENRIAVDRIIEEGDAIAVDGFSFRVLETPGHSDCSLSFHDPARKILIISDATGYFVDYGTYLSSIEHLAVLRAETLCLSHNAVIKGAEDVKAYFAAALAATKAYHDRIVAEARTGKPARGIAEALGAEIHEKTQLLPLGFFQKNCALLVKQSLQHEGISTDK